MQRRAVKNNRQDFHYADYKNNNASCVQVCFLMPADYRIAFNQNKQHHKREKIYESNRAEVRSHKILFRDILYQNIDEKTRLGKIAEFAVQILTGKNKCVVNQSRHKKSRSDFQKFLVYKTRNLNA